MKRAGALIARAGAHLRQGPLPAIVRSGRDHDRREFFRPALDAGQTGLRCRMISINSRLHERAIIPPHDHGMVTRLFTTKP
jgi:hypothetical protein